MAGRYRPGALATLAEAGEAAACDDMELPAATIGASDHATAHACPSLSKAGSARADAAAPTTLLDLPYSVFTLLAAKVSTRDLGSLLRSNSRLARQHLHENPELYLTLLRRFQPDCPSAPPAPSLTAQQQFNDAYEASSRCDKQQHTVYESAMVGHGATRATSMVRLCGDGTMTYCLTAMNREVTLMSFDSPDRDSAVRHERISLPQNLSCAHVFPVVDPGDEPAGVRVVCGAGSTGVLLWQPCRHLDKQPLEAGDRVHRLEAVEGCKRCRRWNLRHLCGHKAPVACVTSAVGGRLVVAAGKDSLVNVWPSHSTSGARNAAPGVPAAHTGTGSAPVCTLRGHGARVASVRSADDLGPAWLAGPPGRLVSGGAGRLILWDISGRGRRLASWHNDHNILDIIPRRRNECVDAVDAACVWYLFSAGAAAVDPRTSRGVVAATQDLVSGRSKGARGPTAALDGHTLAMPTIEGFGVYDIRCLTAAGGGGRGVLYRKRVSGLAGLCLDRVKLLSAADSEGVVLWDPATGRKQRELGVVSDASEAEARAAQFSSWIVDWVAPDGLEDGGWGADPGQGAGSAHRVTCATALAAEGPVVATLAEHGMTTVQDFRGGSLEPRASISASCCAATAPTSRGRFWR